VIERAIVFMIAISLPLILVVEQMARWWRRLARSDEPSGHEDRRPRRHRTRLDQVRGANHSMAAAQPTEDELNEVRRTASHPACHVTAARERRSIRRR